MPGPLLALRDAIAQREGVSRAAVAVAFTLCHPSAPVSIVGTQRRERLAELASATRVRLDRSDVYSLLAASGVELP